MCSQAVFASTVFYMDKDESVHIEAHFKDPIIYFLNWKARAASPGDVPQGDIRVKRSNM